MKLPFRLVDVFAERPMAGNQLCVVPDAPPMPDRTMLAIAREIGFAETTFVTRASGNAYSMRIFTPGGELPFAGHPTLGTAYVLVSEKRVRSPALQTVEAGDFEVSVDLQRGRASVRQLPPVFGPEIVAARDVAEAAGLSPRDMHKAWKPQVVSTGLPHLIVPAASRSAVRHAEPNLRALGHLLKIVEADGYYVFAQTGDGAVRARRFEATKGIFEDAATGSAAGPLGAYLAAHNAPGLPGRVTISQGEEMGRPSVLEVDVEVAGDSWKVTVGGGVFVVAEGTFEVGPA